MILTGAAIRQAVANGAIIIDPFDEELINPNSYNYRLGRVIRWFDGDLDAGAVVEPQELLIPDDGFLFQPGRVHLGHTAEVIGSVEYVPSLIGRSSLGRLGVFLQVSADLGQVGAVHRWTLEIVVTQPVRLYHGMRVGQVSFWSLTGDRQPYEGVYGNYSHPAPSDPSTLFGHRAS